MFTPLVDRPRVLEGRHSTPLRNGREGSGGAGRRRAGGAGKAGGVRRGRRGRRGRDGTGRRAGSPGKAGRAAIPGTRGEFAETPRRSVVPSRKFLCEGAQTGPSSTREDRNGCTERHKRGAPGCDRIVILGVARVTSLSSRRGFGRPGADRPRVLAVMGRRGHQYALTPGRSPTPRDRGDGFVFAGLSRAQMSPGQRAVSIFCDDGQRDDSRAKRWTIDTRAIPVMGGFATDRRRLGAGEATAAPGESAASR
jgi:hypothetical protein